MNHRIAILFAGILYLTMASGCKKSGEGPLNAFKRYPYERFHLVYEYGGDIRGTEELFVSQFGRYEGRYSKFDVFAPDGLRPVDIGAITRLSDVYSLDFFLKSVKHEHSQSLDSLYHLDEQDIPSPAEYLKAEMKKNFFLNIGTDTMAGKLVSRWQTPDATMTLWVWNSILLRKHGISEKGTMDMTVRFIDTLWTVDTMKFIIPPGLGGKNEIKPEDASGTN